MIDEECDVIEECFLLYLTKPYTMKIVLPCLLLIPAFVAAQNINGKPLEALDSEYIEMTTEGKLFSSRLNALIDYGQPVKGLDTSDERYIRNDEGKPMVFNSAAHILNFLSAYGYNLEEVYNVRIDEETEKVMYVLRRAE